MRGIFVILVVLAAAKAEATYFNQWRSSSIRTDKYIEMNREQYYDILQDYNAQIDKFIENYLNRVELALLTNKCVNDLSDQVNSLVSNALSVKYSLNKIINYYEHDIEDCGRDVNQSAKNYAICVVKATLKTNKLTIDNRKAFKTIMETSECVMRVYYKYNWNCNYVFIEV